MSKAEFGGSSGTRALLQRKKPLPDIGLDLPAAAKTPRERSTLRRNLSVAAARVALSTIHSVNVNVDSSVKGAVTGAVLLGTPHTGFEEPGVTLTAIWNMLKPVPIALAMLS
jgi:hypothetical protein